LRAPSRRTSCLARTEGINYFEFEAAAPRRVFAHVVGIFDGVVR